MSTLAEQIELLVDGELDDTQRTQLLRSLDSEPDGWKQCALAFLEDQTLRSFFKNDTSFAVPSSSFFPFNNAASEESESSDHSKARTPEKVSTNGTDRSFLYNRSLITLASCLLIGLVVGIAARSAFRPSEVEFGTNDSNFTNPHLIVEEPTINNPSYLPHSYSGVPETQLVSYRSPTYAGLHPVEAFLPQATALISNRGEPLVPQHRHVPLRPDSPSETILVPCFDNQSVDPNAFSKLFQDASSQVKNRCQYLGKKVHHKFSYQIVNGKGTELILIPTQDTVIHYDEIDRFE